MEDDDEQQELKQQSPSLEEEEQQQQGQDVTSSSSTAPITTSSTNNKTNASNNSNDTYMGKHRLTAAIALLNHQIQIIQEELDKLETVGESSLVCEEFVSTIESTPDALLPETRGPALVGWDRWFEGSSRSRKRWI